MNAARGAPVPHCAEAPPRRGCLRAVREGDVVSLPRGHKGGHQIRNESDALVRIAIVSSNADPDVAEYPDTGKIGIVSESGDSRFQRRSEDVEHAGSD